MNGSIEVSVRVVNDDNGYEFRESSKEPLTGVFTNSDLAVMAEAAWLAAQCERFNSHRVSLEAAPDSVGVPQDHSRCSSTRPSEEAITR